MRPVTSHIGPVLRRHREARHLSLEAVAKKAGLTVVALHNLETCKASSKSDNYERESDVLGLHYPLVVFEAFLDAHAEELALLKNQQAKRSQRDL